MKNQTYGNVLGSPRAEADQELLKHLFIETPEFLNLINTSDYNFIVGRRGSGKSALFNKATEKFKKSSEIILFTQIPPEHETLLLQAKLKAYTDNNYNLLRASTMLVWKLYIMMAVLPQLIDKYLYRDIVDEEYNLPSLQWFCFMKRYAAEHNYLLGSVDIWA